MIFTCKNYDLVFIMDFLAAWFGGKKISELLAGEIARVANMFFGGRR